MDITCSQIMHAEQVLKSQFHITPAAKSCMLNRFQKSQFNIDITCSQIMHAEQDLKSQFHMTPAAKSCMLNRF